MSRSIWASTTVTRDGGVSYDSIYMSASVGANGAASGYFYAWNTGSPGHQPPANSYHCYGHVTSLTFEQDGTAVVQGQATAFTPASMVARIKNAAGVVTEAFNYDLVAGGVIETPNYPELVTTLASMVVIS